MQKEIRNIGIKKLKSIADKKGNKIKAKAIFLSCISIFGIFLVPAILIAMRSYLYAIIAIGTFIASFALFGYYLYLEILPVLIREHLEEQEIMQRFAGNKDKIRFYKGFKKYFDGDFDLEGLKKWFMNHPR